MENGRAGRTILYVEDDAIISLARAAALRRRGYAVRTALTGPEAVAAARDCAVELVLMDIDLGGGMDGAEAARRILAERDLPLIFLTSHQEPEVVERTGRISSYGYVTKGSGDAVLEASMGMAFRLHAAHAALRRKEEELRVSEEKFSKAFHASPDSININRLADGVYVDINEGFARMTGYARADVLGRSSLPGDLGIWARAEDREALVAGLRERGAVDRLEADFRRKDGSTLRGLMSARKMTVDGVECLLSVTRDVSEEVRVREALAASERRFKNFFELAPDLLLIGDMNGTLVDCNAVAPELTGYAREELLGRNIAALFPAEELGKVPLRYDLLEEGRRVISRRRLLRKDGAHRLVEMHTKKIPGPAYIAFVRDITHREEEEGRLRASEERYALAVSAAEEALWDWTPAEGKLYWGPRWLAMLGYGPGAIAPSVESWSALIHPEDLPRATRALDACRSGAADEYREELRFRKADGSWLWVLVRGKVFERGPAGEVLRMAGTHADVDAFKAAREDLAATVREKEALLRELQHRVKNNLNVVHGLLGLERSRLPADDRAAGVFLDLQARLRSMSTLYELLYQQESLDSVDLAAYVAEAARRAFEAYAEGRGGGPVLALDLGPATLCLRRAVPLGLALNELLSNAIKYAYPPGSPGTVRVSLAAGGGAFRLEVADEGRGFPPGLDPLASDSMGLLLLRNLCAQAEARLAFGPGPGVRARIEAPLDKPGAPGGE